MPFHLSKYILLAAIFCASSVHAGENKENTKDCSQELAPVFSIEEAFPAKYSGIRASRLEIKNEIAKTDAAIGKLIDRYNPVVDELNHRARGGVLGFFTAWFSVRPLEHMSGSQLEKRYNTLSLELDKAEALRKELFKDLAVLDEHITAAEGEILGAVKSALVQYMAEHPKYAATIGDLLAYRSIRSLKKEKTLAVAMGNPWDEPSQGEAAAAREILHRLYERGFTVILDGHSRLTPALMAEFPNTYAVTAYSVEGLPAERSVVIQDPYLRWLSFAKQGGLIGSNTSTIAVAAMIYDAIDKVVLTKPDLPTAHLEVWADEVRRMGRDLGLPKFKEIRTKTAKEAADYKPVKGRNAFKRITVEDLSLNDIEVLTEEARKTAARQPSSAKAQAVVFGSGQIEKSSPLVYEIAFDLSAHGYGVATGGSGGAMLAANMGAFDGGGDSIGIPITGRNSLETEKESPTQFHTETLEADSYESRVPLLMHEKQIIAMAPGGGGTIRELVTSLVHLNQGEMPNAGIIFLDQSYYRRLLEFLVNSGLSENVLNRMRIANDRSEFQDSLNSLREAGAVELREPVLNKPRGERREFKLK